MKGRRCDVGGLVFGLFTPARWPTGLIRGSCEAQCHLRMLTVAPLSADLGGISPQRGYSKVFPTYGSYLARYLSFSLVQDCLRVWNSS
jgi:hypothetical protein